MSAPVCAGLWHKERAQRTKDLERAILNTTSILEGSKLDKIRSVFKWLMKAKFFSVSICAQQAQISKMLLLILNIGDKDIDFILIGADGSTTTLEVKWDERIAATGNMFIEHTSNYDTNAKGWFEFCKADYLLYGDAQKRLFYIIDMNELRAQIKRKCYKERRAKDYKRDGSIKYSVGWLVPINDVKHTVL